MDAATGTAARYSDLADRFARTVAAVPSGAWDDPSPCPEWTTRDVVRHVVSTQGMFLGFVGEELPAEVVPTVDTDPVAAWATASAAVQHDLDDPELAGRTFEGLGGEQTFAAAVDLFGLTDLVVHRWDLATAAGLDADLTPGDLDLVRERTAVLGDAMRSQGAFAPELEVPDGADETTRLLAFLGRRAT